MQVGNRDYYLGDDGKMDEEDQKHYWERRAKLPPKKLKAQQVQHHPRGYSSWRGVK